MEAWELEREERAEEFGKSFANAIEQGVRLKPKEAAAQIVIALVHQHRTHQQLFVGALKQAIVEYSKHGFDLRNEAAHKWAQQVADLLDSDLGFPYI